MIGFPVARRRHRNDKRNLHFKAPLAFMGGTLVKESLSESKKNNSRNHLVLS